MAFAALLGLVLGGARLAWTARSDQTLSILRGLLLMTVVTGTGTTTIIEALLTGFDAMARWVRASAECRCRRARRPGRDPVPLRSSGRMDRGWRPR